ncbi:MAG: sigma-70 family RNA polymerase sigma factor [Phycisphaerales bacterium]|nr:sigma-70 family RNA polymerase sigma factor [Phycisphaerales bacterium]
MELVAERQQEQSGPEDLAGVLSAARAGEDWAWREIIRRFGRRVFALAKSRCRSNDVADEITQSVFATLAAKIGSGGYSEVGRFESWLFRIAMNRIRDEVRRSHRQAVAADPEIFEGRSDPAPGPGASVELGAPADLGALARAIERLQEADREIIDLRHRAGMSFKDMSELLNEPLGTLLARHHRALRKLRAILESEGASPGEEVTE